MELILAGAFIGHTNKHRVVKKKRKKEKPAHLSWFENNLTCKDVNLKFADF